MVDIRIIQWNKKKDGGKKNITANRKYKFCLWRIINIVMEMTMRFNYAKKRLILRTIYWVLRSMVIKKQSTPPPTCSKVQFFTLMLITKCKVFTGKRYSSAPTHLRRSPVATRLFSVLSSWLK